MFARRFYPGRFFAPRYWPAPGPSISALPPVVFDLSLSQQPQETIGMNCLLCKQLRLQGYVQVTLCLDTNVADPIALDQERALAIDLHYQPTIELTLEGGHAV